MRKFSTNDDGKPIDPFTGELLVPVEELEKAVEGFPRINYFSLPPKTDDWLLQNEMAKLLGIAKDGQRFRPLWDQLKALCSQSLPTVIDGHNVECGFRSSGKVTVFCAHKNQEEWFRQKTGKNIPPKTEAWKSAREVASLLNTSMQNTTYVDLWEGIKSGFDQTNTPFTLDDYTFNCGYREDGSGRKWFCIHIDDINFLRRKLGRENLEEKTENWLAQTAVARALRMAPEDPAFRELWSRCESTYNANIQAPVIIDDHEVQCGNKKAGLHTRFCVHKDELNWFCIKLGRATEHKTPDWKAQSEFFGLAGLSFYNQDAIDLWQECLNAYIQNPQQSADVRGHIVRCGNKQSICNVFCLHESELTWFLEELGRAEKKGGWVAKEEFAALVGVRKVNEHFVALWDRLSKAYSASPDSPVVIDGHITEFAELVSERGRKVFYINPAEISWFKQKLNVPDIKTSEWLTVDEMAKTLDCSAKGAKFAALWQEIKDAYVEPSKPVVIGDHIVNCGIKRTRTISAFCVNKSEVDWFRKKLEISKKTSEWRTETEYSQILRIYGSKFKELWAKIKEAYDEHPEELVTINGFTVDCGYRRNGNMTSFCVNESAQSWFKEQLNLKTPGWLTRDQVAAAIDIPRYSKKYIEQWAHIQSIYDAKPESPVIVENHEVKCGNKQSGSSTTFYLHESEIEWLKRKIENGISTQILTEKKRIKKTSPTTKIGDADEPKLPENVKQALEEKNMRERDK